MNDDEINNYFIRAAGKPQSFMVGDSQNMHLCQNLINNTIRFKNYIFLR